MSLAPGSRTIRTVLDVDANPLVRGMARAEQATRATAEAMRRGGEQMRRATAGYASDARNTEGSLVRLGRAAEKNSREFTQAGMAVAAAGALMTGATVASAKAAIDWESAWISVRKVLTGTPEEFAALEGELRELARTLPSSHAEIAAVGETAARLGVATGDVAKFTRTMIDMGETTTMSAEEAANGIARFSNVMGTATDDASRVGSAIVDLGNNFATTETEILSMAQRLAAASNVAGLTEAEVLGLSAAMSEVGINAEAGGTAMSRVIMRISAATEEGGAKLRSFADVAGMSGEEFAAAWRDRPVEALMAVVAGLGEMTETGEGTFGMLEELGLQDIRVANMMLSLAGNAEAAAGAVDMASTAWEENTALAHEAEQRYASVDSQIRMAKASIYDAAITMGQVFLPVIVEVSDMVAQAANVFANLDPATAGFLGSLGAIAGGLGLVAGGLLLVTPRAMETYRAFQLLGIVGPQTSRAIRGVASFLTGPWGVAIGAAVIATGYFIREHQKKKAAIEEVRGTLDEETAALTDNTRAWAARAADDAGALEWAERLGLASGTVTDALMGEEDALQAVADATERASAEALRNADAWTGASGDYAKAADAGRRLNDFLAANADVLSEAQSEQARLNAEMEGSVRTTEHLKVETRRLAAQAHAYQQSQEGVNAAIEQWTPAAERAAAAGEEVADAFWDMHEAVADVSRSFIDSSGALSVAGDAAQAWAEKQAEATGNAEASWEDFVGDFTGTVDEWLSELERMMAAQSDWEVNMLILASRASSGVVKAFEDLGPEGAMLLQEFLDGGVETLERGEAIFGESAARGVRAYADGMTNTDVIKAAAATWGDDIVEEIARKLESGEMTAAEVVKAYNLEATIALLADPTRFDDELALAVSAANAAEGIASIDGTSDPLQGVLAAAMTMVNLAEGVAAIDGNPDPIRDKLEGVLAEIRGSTEAANIDGDSTLGLAELGDLMRTVRLSTESVKVGGNTQPGINSVFGLLNWVARQSATVSVYTRHVGGLNLGGADPTRHSALATGGILDRGTRRYASGGIDDRGRPVERRSMLAGPRYGRTNILWAEDSTRREAYLSDHPSYRAQNERYLAIVAGWYGKRVVDASSTKSYATGHVAGSQPWAPRSWTPAPAHAVPAAAPDFSALAVAAQTIREAAATLENLELHGHVYGEELLMATKKAAAKLGPRATWMGPA